MDPTGGYFRDDDQEERPATGSRKTTNNAARQREELMTSMNQSVRAFAETMRATSAERKRLSRERERLLESERAVRAEAEASRKRLREVLESIDDAFFALDQRWCFTYVNNRAVDLAGRPREGLIGKSVLEAFPELVEGGESAELIRAENEVTQFEHYSPRLGRWLRYRAYPSRSGLSIYVTDITEARETQEALGQSEERYRSLATATSSIVWTAPANGASMKEMPSWEEFTGQTFEEYKGFGWLDAVHPEDRPPPDAWEHLSPDQAPLVTEYRLRRRDGEYRRVVSRGAPVLDENGEVREWIGTITDVEDKRRAEEERERFLARERTARAQAEERRRISRDLHDRVAHSMGVVHQSLELHEALKEQNPEMARAKIELARKMAKEALDSTRNLSEELRRPEVRRGLEAALADLLRDVVSEEIHCTLTVEGDEAPVPPGTRDQLFLILREAVRNAAKHSGCGRLAVDLELTPEKAVGRVEDDGRGFDTEGAVWRSSNGLRSMKERTSLVGGALDVSSAPGEGTRIRVSVPLEEA